MCALFQRDSWPSQGMTPVQVVDSPEKHRHKQIGPGV